MTDFFHDHSWVAALVFGVLYISDHTMTFVCARLYQTRVREKMAFEGSYEITPFHQRDVDALRRVSPRFVIVLVAGVAVVWLFGWTWADSSPELFAFLLGGLIVVQLTIHVRHVRNYVMFRAMLTDAVRGRVEYTRPMLLKASAVEIFAFAALYAVLFVFTGSLFVLGGVLGCVVLATQHWTLMRRARSAAPLGYR